LTAHLQDEPTTQFATALGETVNATRLLMDKFFQIEESKRAATLQKESFAECRKAQNEVSCF
jgi:E3 ubiquitin-protein ligase BRE1